MASRAKTCPNCGLLQDVENYTCDDCGWDGFTTAVQREAEREAQMELDDMEYELKKSLTARPLSGYLVPFGVGLVAVGLLVASMVTAHGQSRSVIRSDRFGTSITTFSWGPSGPIGRVLNVPRDLTPTVSQEQHDQWMARCDPMGWVDDLGVTRLRYKAVGCEFGKWRD